MKKVEELPFNIGLYTACILRAMDGENYVQDIADILCRYHTACLNLNDVNHEYEEWYLNGDRENHGQYFRD